MERAAGSQHPVHLADGAGGVGNGAQRERAERGVDRTVVERQVFTIEPDELDARIGDAATRSAESLRPTNDGSTA